MKEKVSTEERVILPSKTSSCPSVQIDTGNRTDQLPVAEGVGRPEDRSGLALPKYQSIRLGCFFRLSVL